MHKQEIIRFDPKNRIRKIENNLYCISIGKQTNCGGIACMLASIECFDDEQGSELTVDSLGNMSDKRFLFGSDIPKDYIEAIYSGFFEGINSQNIRVSLKFCLVGILYHPVDSNLNMQKIASRALVNAWCEENF